MLSISVPQIMTIKTLGHPVISELRERSSVVSHSRQLTTGNYIEVLNSAASTRSRTGHGILALPPCIVSPPTRGEVVATRMRPCENLLTPIAENAQNTGDFSPSHEHAVCILKGQLQHCDLSLAIVLEVRPFHSVITSLT